MVSKKNFLIQMNFKNAVHSLSDADAGRVFKSLFEYVETGTDSKSIGPAADIVLLMFKGSIDEARMRYNEMCQKKKENIQKRWNKNRNTTEYKCIQPNTTEYKCIHNDNEDDNVTINNDSYKTISSNDDKSNMPLDSSAGGVNYQGIIQFYNSTMEQSGATIPKVKSIEGTRKKHVSARIREYGRNAFADMIRKAAASDFLNGRNERGFTATFDWLIRPSNFIKVIEGNYDSNKNYSNSNGNPRLKDNQRRGTLEVSATSADDYKTTF